MKECLNKVDIIGILLCPLVYSHNMNGERIYKMTISSFRKSGIPDEITVCVPEHVHTVLDGKLSTVHVIGRLASRNYRINDKWRLDLYVLANSVECVSDEIEHKNAVSVEGYVTNVPTYRFTPLGRVLSDTVLANNSKEFRAHYIPSIAWGVHAKHMSSMCTIGSFISASGRLQSRVYRKGNVEMIAHELSLAKFKLIEKGRKNENNLQETEVTKFQKA